MKIMKIIEIKKIFVFLCLMLFFDIANCRSVEAANSNLSSDARRSIAIVFDNSDSMVRDSGKKHEKNKYLKRWAQATYALRTFIHMVNENDVLHLYTVDDGSSVADKGVFPKGDINKVISKLGVSYVTKMYGMREAYRWVNNQPTTEKWVVILTDGKFYKNGKKGKKLSADESIGKYINIYKNYGINTICVGLGLEKKAEIELKRLDDGKYCNVFCTLKRKRNSLKENKEINKNILAISKKIYTMEKLSDKQIRKESNLAKDNAEFRIAENGTLIWKTDTEFSKYIQEVIIMAQIEGFVKKKNVSDGMEVIYSDRDFAWGDDKDIKQFNQDALDYYGSYSYLIDRKLIKKINSSCYIQHYSGKDLEEKKIKFKLPKGKSMEDYTYQIYYVLSTGFVSVLKQGKTELVAENQNSFITEGNYQIDYNVISPDGEKLSKNLLAIRNVKKQVKLKIGNESVVSGSDKDFIYHKETKNSVQKKNNQYVASVSYNENIVNSFHFSVEPDLGKYKLSFWQEEQDINIDKENENKILLKLTGKGKHKDVDRLYYWLKDKINESKKSKRITYGFQNKDNEDVSALGIRLKKTEIVPEKDFIKIGLPIEIVKSNGIEMGEHYQVSVSVQGEGEAKLVAENGNILITQEDPEICLKQEEVTVIEKIKNDTNLSISTYVLNKEIDVEIVDVELMLQTEGKAKCLSFKFDKKTNEIICKANINIVRYFFSGIHNDKLSYEIHLKRNGKDYFKKSEDDQKFVKFRWKINHLIWSLILLILVVIIVILVLLSLSIQNGSLLLDELLCNDYDLERFFIVWLSPLKKELVVDNKISKCFKTIRLFPCFDDELKYFLGRKKVVLGGRKNGYYLKNFDELDNISGISVKNKFLERPGDYITIELQRQNTDDRKVQQSNSCFQILYKNKREKRCAKGLLLCNITVAVMGIIYFLFWLNS